MTHSDGRFAQLGHLVRRFAGALSPCPPSQADHDWAGAHLLPAEAALWNQMSAPDRRHSIEVARRFSASAVPHGRTDIAAALLHDIGKLPCRLGTFGRVAATVVGPRGHRFRQYHDHERIGAEMLREAASDAETIALVDGSTDRVDVLAALHRADNV